VCELDEVQLAHLQPLFLWECNCSGEANVITLGVNKNQNEAQKVIHGYNFQRIRNLADLPDIVSLRLVF